MFAPPDPSSPTGSSPVSSPPSPPEQSFAPTLPGRTPVLAFAPTPPPVVPIAAASDSPAPFSASSPDLSPDRQATSEEPAALPSRLLRTRWLRRLVVTSNALSIPGLFVGDLVGLALVALSLVGLVIWSGLSAINVRRARPATLHGSAPHPATVVLSWFVAPVFGVLAAIAIVSVSMWASSGTFDEEGGRMMLLAFTVFVSSVGMLIASYQPYRSLAKCAKWVYTDSGRFRKWFVAPILAAALAGVIQILARLIALSDTSNGSSSTATIGAVALWVVSFSLPWLTWLFFASRAMGSLEAGIAHAHDRALREATDPSELVPAHAGGPTHTDVPAVSAPNV